MPPSRSERHSASPPQVVAGLGCRRGCSMDELLGLLVHSLQSQRLTLDNLAGLASVIHKQDEPGLLALSERLGLALIGFTAEALAPYQATEAGNALSLAMTGSPAVAEPCALALAARLGSKARLLAGKTRSAGATCALASFEESSA